MHGRSIYKTLTSNYLLYLIVNLARGFYEEPPTGFSYLCAILLHFVYSFRS
jgi:hypothetical protein